MLMGLLYTAIAVLFGGWWWLFAIMMWVLWLIGQVVDARLAYYRARFPDIPLYSPPDPRPRK